MKKILVIDDDEDLLLILKDFLCSNGHEVSTAANGRLGLKELEGTMDLVLCDIKLPDFNGLEILSKIKKLQPHIPVIMITGYSDVSTAVAALRRGATDYVTKPLFPDEILLQIKEITSKSSGLVQEMSQASGSNEITKGKVKPPNLNSASTYIEGKSDIMNALNKNIALVAPTDMGVVVSGETGSGKEFVAKRLHQLSRRAKKPFISLDCGALPTELAASELFGHKKGAYTGAISDKIGHFELADGGTLFLDEVANLNYENQIKLLRVLQERKVKRMGDTVEKPVDFRLIVATNENLSNRVNTGEFREDLFYRLNEFSVHLPPIRKRGDDVLIFAKHFLTFANAQLSKDIKGFSDEVSECFLGYKWPGNLREIRNVVKRATLLCEGDTITKREIPVELMINDNEASVESFENMDLKAVAKRAERAAIIQALKKHQFNKTAVSKALKVDRKTLYNKINAYGIKL
jgi:two-component system response regulator HydG